MKPVTTEIFQIDITDPKAELLISFILSGITGYITVWYNNGKPVAIHDMVAALQSIMAYSVSILKINEYLLEMDIRKGILIFQIFFKIPFLIFLKNYANFIKLGS